MYNAPRITIEASGVTVAEVLREIGRKVGFSIVDARSSDARLSFSIHNASLSGALQRILRSENHVLLYRKGTQTIDTVMLLGARLAKGPAPFNRPDHAFSRSEGQDQIRRSPSAEIAPTSATPVSGAPPKTQADLAYFGRSAQESPEVANATDLLLRHAWSSVPASQPTSPSGGVPVASSPAISRDANAADPSSTLAITTRLAQQNLTKLIEALSTTTSSMLSSNRR